MSDNFRFTSALPGISRFIMMIFFAVFPRLLLAPLLLRISADLQIGYSTASSFFLSSSAGFATGLVISGFIAHLLTHRWTIICGAFLTGSMLLSLSVVQSVPLFHLFMFFLGFSNGLYHGSGIASVARTVPDAFRGRALAFHETGPNMAFILAPILSALLAPHIGWRGVFAATGFAAMGAGLLFALTHRGPSERSDPPHFRNLKLFASIPAYWTLLLLLAIATSLLYGAFSVLPTFLAIEHNLPEAFLNNLIGMSRIAGFFTIFAAGYLADRLGFRVVLATILIFTGGLTMLIGVLSGKILLVTVFLQPMITQSFFPVAFGAITRLARPAARNLAISLAIPFSNLIGGGLAPPLITAAGAAGYFGLGFVVLGATAVLSTLLLLLLPSTISDRSL